MTLVYMLLAIYVIGMIVGAGFASAYVFSREEYGEPCDAEEKKTLYCYSILAWPYALGGAFGCTAAAVEILKEESKEKKNESN